MKQVNSENAKILREALEEALSAVALKHNLNIDIKTIRMGDTYFNVPLVVNLSEETDDVRKSNENYARMFNLPLNCVGKDITMGGSVYTVVGFNPTKPKFAVKVVEKKTRKPFNTTAESVKAYFQRNPISESVNEPQVPNQLSKSEAKLKGGLALKPNPIQRKEAEDQGVNFNNPKAFIVMTPEGKIIADDKSLKKPLKEYGNGLLKMMMGLTLKRYPVGSVIVNDNIATELLVK
jgi:hypothetical protein